MAKARALSILALLLLSVFTSAASFADVTNDNDLDIFEMKLNGDDLDWNGWSLESLDFGDKLNLRVGLRSYVNFENVKMMAFLTSEYDQDKAMDQTKTFDMTGGVNYRKTLKLEIPESLDRDTYTLTVMITDKNGILYTEDFKILLESETKHQIKIKDVIVTPEIVKAGRQIKVKVKMENIGKDNEEDVKVTASVPALTISDSDYISDIKINEIKYSEPIYLITEKCTEPGTYDLKVKVTYSNSKESVEKKIPIEVVGNGACVANTPSSEGKLTVTLDKQVSSLTDGSAEYAIALSNSANVDKTIVLDVESSGMDVKFQPSSVIVLAKNEMKMVKMTVTPKEGIAAGEHSFVLNVKSGNEKLASQTLKVKVDGSSGSLNSALEIGLVVVVILLAIIGVLIGFNKLKEDDEEASDDDEMTSQTYY